MKKFLLSIVMLLTLATTVMAQGFGGQRNRQQMNPEEMLQRRTEMMAEMLGLSEEQKAAVYELNKKQAEQMRGQGQRQGQGQRGNRGNRGQRPEANDSVKDGQRGGMQSFMAEYNNELKKILTEEQYKKYEESMSQMRQRGGRGQGGSRSGRGQGRPNRD